jgi:hypothetical protein
VEQPRPTFSPRHDNRKACPRRRTLQHAHRRRVLVPHRCDRERRGGSCRRVPRWWGARGSLSNGSASLSIPRCGSSTRQVSGSRLKNRGTRRTRNARSSTPSNAGHHLSRSFAA